MVDLGRYNKLVVLRLDPRGAFLDGAQFGDILCPQRYLPRGIEVGEEIEVFLYNDSEDRVVATTQIPKARVGECAYLKVVGINQAGAFLDWGLGKDLLVPYSEQQKPLRKGYSYAVYLYVDEATQRIVASSKLERHLSASNECLRPWQRVELLIYGKSDLGFKAIVDHRHLGQLYAGETFRRLHFGERVGGYIKQVRSDGKLDLALQRPPHLERDRLAAAIVDNLRQNRGTSKLTDNSPPEEIYQTYGVSKASYKKALGKLYKQRTIAIEKHQITLL